MSDSQRVTLQQCMLDDVPTEHRLFCACSTAEPLPI